MSAAGFICWGPGSTHACALPRPRVRCYCVERYAVSPSFSTRHQTKRIPGLPAVTHAVLTNWEYMDVIRLAADPKCSSNLVNSITTVDRLLKLNRLRGPLKNLFGLGGLESDQDFVSVLTVCPLLCYGWQGRVLIPAYAGGKSVSACFVAGSELGPRGRLNDIRSFLRDTKRRYSDSGRHCTCCDPSGAVDR